MSAYNIYILNGQEIEPEQITVEKNERAYCTYEGRQYSITSKDNNTSVCTRIAHCCQALFATLLTLGLGLFSLRIRNLWKKGIFCTKIHTLIDKLQQGPSHTPPTTNDHPRSNIRFDPTPFQDSIELLFSRLDEKRPPGLFHKQEAINQYKNAKQQFQKDVKKIAKQFQKKFSGNISSVQSLLQKHPLLFLLLGESVQKKPSVILTCLNTLKSFEEDVDSSGYAYSSDGYYYILENVIQKSPTLSNDKEIARCIISIWPALFEYCGDTIKSDSDFVKEMLNQDKEILTYASDSVKKNPELALKALKLYMDISNLPKEVRTADFLKKCYDENINILSQWKRNNDDAAVLFNKFPELPMQIVTKDAESIQQIPAQYWNMKLISLALRNNIKSFQYICSSNYFKTNLKEAEKLIFQFVPTQPKELIRYLANNNSQAFGNIFTNPSKLTALINKNPEKCLEALKCVSTEINPTADLKKTCAKIGLVFIREIRRLFSPTTHEYQFQINETLIINLLKNEASHNTRGYLLDHHQSVYRKTLAKYKRGLTLFPKLWDLSDLSCVFKQ